jgi:hypothetical protein
MLALPYVAEDGPSIAEALPNITVAVPYIVVALPYITVLLPWFPVPLPYITAFVQHPFVATGLWSWLLLVGRQVRELLHKRIRDTYLHPQFNSDVMKPLNIEALMDQEVSADLCSLSLQLHLRSPSLALVITIAFLELLAC